MTLDELEARVTQLEDLQQIEKLQRIYGYYVDYGEWDKVVDLFSDKAESVEVIDHGLYLGKKGVKRFFSGLLGKSQRVGTRPPGILALVLQLQGVVDIDQGGKTAKGRWHGWMIDARPCNGIMRQTWGHGIYENGDVKEKGKWLFQKVHFNLTFRTPYEDGWLKTPVIGQYGPSTDPETKPDAPPTAYHPYPSGYHIPFHWQHDFGRANG
jgi:hypothetical protein